MHVVRIWLYLHWARLNTLPLQANVCFRRQSYVLCAVVRVSPVRNTKTACIYTFSSRRCEQKKEIKKLSKYRGKTRSFVFVPFTRIPWKKKLTRSSLRHIRPLRGTFVYLHWFLPSAQFEWSTSNAGRFTLGAVWILGCTCSRAGIGIAGDNFFCSCSE